MSAITLWGTFVYDDVMLILDDARVQEPGKWLEFFRTRYLPSAPDPTWRPLASISLAVQWQIHGVAAWGYHMVNILLYAAGAALVCLLASRLSGRNMLGLIAGLLFAVHPIHVEPVAMIVGRAELLSGIGVLGAVLLFSKWPMTLARATAIAACFLVGLLSKEQAIVTPLLLAAIYVVQRLVGDRSKADSSQRQALLALTALICLITAGYIVYRESIMHLVWDRFHLRWTVNPVCRASGIDRLVVPVEVLGRYVALLVFPLRLSPDYGAAVTSFHAQWDQPYVYVGIVTLLSISAATFFALRRRMKLLAISLLAAGMCYVLVSNGVYLIGTIMGDRLVYLSSAFLAIVAAAGLCRLSPRARWTALTVIIVALSVRFVTYAWRWNDALRLFSLSREDYPQSVYLHVLEAEQLLQRGRAQEAEEVLATGRQLVPESANVWAMSARVAERLGHTERAREYGARALDLELNPPHMVKSGR